MRKVLQMLSVSVDIVVSLISYYIGMEKERSLQAFFIGIALWLVSTSIFTISKTYNEENSKRCSLQEKCTFSIKLVSLALILPFGVVLPFLGNIRCVDGIWLSRIDIQTWLIYSPIFAAFLIISYLLSDIYKKRKS